MTAVSPDMILSIANYESVRITATTLDNLESVELRTSDRTNLCHVIICYNLLYLWLNFIFTPRTHTHTDT